MSILECLDKNKEWLFSGVGVAIVGCLGTLLWRKFFPRTASKDEAVVILQVSNEKLEQAITSKTLNETPPAHITRIASITVAEITEALEKAPPLQKDEVAQHYNGLNVQWETRLWNATKEGDDSIRLTLDFGSGDTNLVFCNVRLSDYRELGVLPKGAPITVMGRIRAVAPKSATLENVQLFFHSPLNDNSA